MVNTEVRPSFLSSPIVSGSPPSAFTAASKSRYTTDIGIKPGSSGAKTLSFIKETEDEIIGYKNLVAYWIDTCELETIEYYINYFASNIDVDEETGEETYVGEELHIDFLNNNNIKGFTEYVESILEDQE